MDVRLSGRHPDHTVIAIAGDLDLAASHELLVWLRPFLHTRHCGIRLDLSGVTFLDSSGLQALLAMAQCAKDHQRTIRLAAKSPAVDRVLELVGLPPGSSYLTEPTQACSPTDCASRVSLPSGVFAIRHRTSTGLNRSYRMCVAHRGGW